MPAKSLLLSFAALLLLAVSSSYGQQVMDNDAVLKLAKSGLSEDLIVQTINASPGHYDTGTDALIALKSAGLSDKEVGAMLSKNANPNGTGPASAMPTTVVLAAAPPPLPGVTDVGLYYKDRAGQWTDVSSENVNFKSGGVLKSALTDGIVKGDLNGHLTGPTSKLRLTNPVEFVVYVLEGQNSGDYQLLKMHEHKDGREFRSVTGGVFHSSGGAERDTVDFESKKLAPRTYSITVAGKLAPGEYGFLPPSTMNTGKSLASSGKMYTFTIVE
jgi:hypothetical protein